MDSRTKTNRGLWDGWAALHARSAFYDVAGFRDGKSSLKATELAEVGNVDGKRLLHLQCHLGLDTLSWARLGADVTGVDFSERAIAEARALAADCDLPARFVCQDVLELDLGERFDLVFASYGVLCWIRDRRRWARVAARHLAPGGSLYLIEFLHEFPFSSYGCFPFLEEESEHRWVVRGAAVPVPLMFSIKASATAAG